MVADGHRSTARATVCKVLMLDMMKIVQVRNLSRFAFFILKEGKNQSQSVVKALKEKRLLSRCSTESVY